MSESGLPLPTVNGIALVNPSVTLGNGYMVIETDITYVPSAKLFNNNTKL